MYKKIYSLLTIVLAFGLGQKDSFLYGKNKKKYFFKKKLTKKNKKKIFTKKRFSKLSLKHKKHKRKIGHNFHSSSVSSGLSSFITPQEIIAPNVKHNNNSKFKNFLYDDKGKAYEAISNPGQTGWNCFDKACWLEDIMGISKDYLSKAKDNAERALLIRQELVKKVLNTQGNERLKIKRWLADEMYESSFAPTFFPGAGEEFSEQHYGFPPSTKKLVEDFLSHQWKYNGLVNNENGNLSIDMSFFDDYEANGIPKDELRKSIVDEFSKNDDIFKSYVRDFYGEASYFAKPDSSGGGSMINVIAELYNVHFVVYGQKSNGEIFITNDIGNKNNKTYTILLHNNHFEELKTKN